MNTTKEYQLRVRISDEARASLDQVAVKRGKDESISDLVRESIGLFLESPDGPFLRLTPRTLEILGKLSKETHRPLAQIIEECIEGIFTLLEDDRSPLIVEEIKLHRSYRRAAAKNVTRPRKQA